MITVNELNNEVGDAIKLFAVRGKVKLIGSNALRASQFGVDYDAESHLSSNPALSLQHAYHEARKDPDIYVMELKCGHDPRLVYKGDFSRHSLSQFLANPLIPPAARKEIEEAKGEAQVELVRDLFILRWTPEEVCQGEIKLIDGTTRTLAQCCLDKTTMKIDLIVKVGNTFAEISENYYVETRAGTNFEETSRKEIEASLEQDIHYYAKTDSFKALKRLYSLFRLHPKKHADALAKLTAFFNGQVGFLNKIKAELRILDTLLKSHFREVAWADVIANLQMIKEQIAHLYEIPVEDKVFQQLDAVTPATVQGTIEALEAYFAAKVNDAAKLFLQALQL